jgi:F-type H+-transporting ATPase subunit epsilon
MTLEVQVVSPERVLWSGEADRVITRTDGEGEIAFLSGHVPFMGALGVGVTEILQGDGSVLRLAVHGGFVEVSDDRVSILSDTAELADQIDEQRALRAKERAEQSLRERDEDELRVALRRAETRLRAVGSAPSA